MNRPRTVPPLPKHPYRDDGSQDQDGQGRCLGCGLGREQGRGKAAHQPVEVNAAARAVSARILGEHIEQEN